MTYKFNPFTGNLDDVGTSGGASSFLGLTDTPSSYAGQSGKAVVVNGAENALVFTAVSGTGTVTSVASADGSVTVTNGTTTPDLAVVKAPRLTTARTISLTGDVTHTSTAFDGTANISGAATIANGAVTLAKQADVATGTVFYRKTAGTGSPETQTLATLKTDLGLTGTNSGDQTITLTGDVTGSGTSSFATTLANVNANTGSFGLAGSVAQFTVNAKGLITAAANVAISITSTAVSDFSTAVAALITGKADKITTISTTAPLSGGGDLSADRTITTSMSTNKLIGRGTAGTGVMEEITLGTNLSFSGTTLNATGGGASDYTIWALQGGFY